MRTAKLSWLLFVLALFLVGPVQAQDKKKEPKKTEKEKKVVYKGKTVDQWIRALKDTDKRVRLNAAVELARDGFKSRESGSSPS